MTHDHTLNIESSSKKHGPQGSGLQPSPPHEHQSRQTNTYDFDSWDFIYSYFVHKPQVREWLFRREQPSTSELVQCLMNNPVLNGFKFGDYKVPSGTTKSTVELPDIGDLNTVFTQVDDVLMGYVFGFKGVMPIIPSVYQETGETIFANPKAIVRRTAKKWVSIANIQCYIGIEFTWMFSGVLTVTTSQFGIRQGSTSKHPSRLGPVLDEGEIRIFLPDEANRLVKMASNLSDHAYIEAFSTPSPSPSSSLSSYYQKTNLPKEFLNPKWYLVQTVCEPKYYNNPKLLQSCFSNEHNDAIINQIIFDTKNIELSFEQKLGRRLSAHPFQRFSIQDSNARSRLLQMWSNFSEMMSNARRKGSFRTSLVGRNFSSSLNGLESSYTYLSTHHGISVGGRIQQLLTQLGIHYSQPELDRILLTYSEEQQNEGEFCVPFRQHQTFYFDSENHSDSSHLSTTRTSCSQNPISHGSSSGTVDRHLQLPTTQIHLNEIVPNRSVTEQTITKRRRTVSENFSTFGGTDQNFTQYQQFKVKELSDNIFQNQLPTSNTKTIERIINYNLIDDVTETLRPTSESNNNNQSEEQPEKVKINKPTIESSTHSTDETVDVVVEGRRILDVDSRELWECGKCGMIIRGKRGNLKRHVLVKHYNIRQFQCQVPGCERKFQNRVNLKRHESAVHEGRPYRCSKCPRCFKKQEDLESHVQNSHEKGGDPLACDLCGRCFDLRGTLNRHRRTVHGHQLSSTAQPPSKSETES